MAAPRIAGNEFDAAAGITASRKEEDPSCHSSTRIGRDYGIGYNSGRIICTTLTLACVIGRDSCIGKSAKRDRGKARERERETKGRDLKEGSLQKHTYTHALRHMYEHHRAISVCDVVIKQREMSSL